MKLEKDKIMVETPGEGKYKYKSNFQALNMNGECEKSLTRFVEFLKIKKLCWNFMWEEEIEEKIILDLEKTKQ